MPSYRGIILDAIHPNIKAALDVERDGFSRDDKASYNHITTRTPWMRSVPFVIPQDPEDTSVPKWQDWVLYSMQAISDSAGSVNFGRYGSAAKDGLYRPTLRNTPAPAISGITVSNKGDLGTIRRATLSIKCYHESDLANLELMYMVPGTSILIEWGWHSSTKTKSPIPLSRFNSGASSLVDSENPRQAIQEEILKRIFDTDDILREYDVNVQNNSAGLYDGLVGSVTKFNWTNAADGTYDISIDIMAPNNLVLGIPTNTYRLGCNIADQSTGKTSPVNDVEAIYYQVFLNSVKIQADEAKKLATAQLEATLAYYANEEEAEEQVWTPYDDLALPVDAFQPMVVMQEATNARQRHELIEEGGFAASTAARVEAIDVKLAEQLAVAKSIVYTTTADTNFITWGDPTVKAIGANNTPLMTVETPGIGVKVDYTLERSLNNANDLGISVYGETYVSWRFIEDYIINELFMPRLSSDKLEVYFSSIIPIPRAADAEEDAPIEWDSVRIINNKWLRSLNPEICILPGQESTVSEDSAKVEALLGSEATEFINSTFTADNEMSEGYLRNIMVNIDLVRKASIDADNVSDFALEILTQVSEACGSPWSFKVVTNTELGIISVIDENHGGNISNYTTVKESNPTPYIFSGNGDTNITRDLKIQTKLPNEIQALAYYAMSGAGPETSTDINMFKLYGTAVRDRLKKSQVRYNTETKLAQDEAANTNIWNAYRKAVSSTRDDLMMDLQDNAGYREATDSAKNFVKQFICNSSTSNKLYSPPIPIDISLTLNGVSGIYMGNSIMVNTVSQGGILPERYKDIVALQVTSVDQQIGSNTWSTSINTLMRPITKLPAPRVPEDEVVTTIVSEVTTQSPGDDVKEVTADNLSEFSKYLTFTDTPYINGAPMEQQTFYAMRGSDSNGIFETEDDGIEYIAQKMLESLLALAQAANDAGHTLSINDAYRSYAKQQYLYDGYKNGTPGFNPAARPGTSKHQSGDAIDIDVGKGDIYRWLVQHAWKYGYMRTVAGEEWHWVYAPNVDVYSRVPKGHPTWYGVEMEA